MNRKSWILGFGILTFTLLSLFGKAIGAEEYPAKTLTILCGFSAGGSADRQIRLLAPYLQKHLGKSIMIENLTGAQGILATNKVFSSPPDGYTLLVATNTVILLQEKYLPETSRYKTRDLMHVSCFAREDFIVLTHPEVWKNFADFSKAAQSKRLRMGIAGKGTVGHVYPVMLEEMMGIKFNMIPLEGGGPAMTALAGKHVDATTTMVSSSSHLVRSGTLNPLLVLSGRRHPTLPQTPIPEEVGLKSIQLMDYNTGIFGPPKLPLDRVRILEEAIAKAVKESEYQKKATEMVVEVHHLNSQDYLANTEKHYSQIEKYVKILKESQ